MCQHRPPCPPADSPDRAAACTKAFHPEQGWSLLCNGVILFDDTGELLPDVRAVPSAPLNRYSAARRRLSVSWSAEIPRPRSPVVHPAADTAHSPYHHQNGRPAQSARFPGAKHGALSPTADARTAHDGQVQAHPATETGGSAPWTRDVRHGAPRRVGHVCDGAARPVGDTPCTPAATSCATGSPLDELAAARFRVEAHGDLPLLHYNEAVRPEGEDA